MKKLILSIGTIFALLEAYSQQDPMVSQYMFNGLLLNPAYGGTHSYYNASFLYRSQWVNFDGAPETQVLAADGPFAKDKVGLGLVLSHDKIGVTEETDFFANYSYKINVGPGKFSFGVKAGVSQYKANVTSLVYWDEGDEMFSNNVNNKVIPKFGYGMYYYTDRWYAGLSIPTLIAYQKGKKFSFDVEQSSYMRRHYYLNAGIVVDMGENFKIKPSFLVKYLPAAPVQTDINANVYYKEMISLGVSFRTGDAVVAMAEYIYDNRIKIGYSYDYTLSKIRDYSSGSHEIMLGYMFGGPKKRTHSYF
jgi:type IX secretion system PorP/SprF family membrane protein